MYINRRNLLRDNLILAYILQLTLNFNFRYFNIGDFWEIIVRLGKAEYMGLYMGPEI